MAVIIVCILLIIAVIHKKLNKRKSKRYDARGFDCNRIHKNGTKYDDFGYDYFGYDANGYSKHGYNAFGKNIEGEYNRFFDTKGRRKEGFLSPTRYPIALTDHARLRMKERLNISDYHKMDVVAIDAYRFGKSKWQIKKSSASLIDEIEQKHGNGILLIYRNYVFVFSCENVLITVYKNENIAL